MVLINSFCDGEKSTVRLSFSSFKLKSVLKINECKTKREEMQDLDKVTLYDKSTGLLLVGK